MHPSRIGDKRQLPINLSPDNNYEVPTDRSYLSEGRGMVVACPDTLPPQILGRHYGGFVECIVQ